MVKGIVIQTILAMLVGGLIIIFILPILFGIGKKLYAYTGEKIGFTPPLTELEKAIICSNLICNRDDASVRRKFPCPLDDREVFERLCYPWLTSKGIYEEVCYLPSLFNVDPCSTLAFPIEIDINSDSDAVFREDKIKEKINSFSKKWRDLNLILFDKTNNIYVFGSGFYLYIPQLFVLKDFIDNIDIFSIWYELKFNVIIVPMNDISSYDPSEYSIQTPYYPPVRKIEVLKEGKIRPGKYYVYSQFYKGSELTSSEYRKIAGRAFTTQFKILNTIISNRKPYLTLGEDPLEIEIDLDSVSSLRYLRIERTHAGTGKIETDNFLLGLIRSVDPNYLTMFFMFYNETSRKVEINSFYLTDGDEYYCPINDGYIKFEMIPTNKPNIKKLLISYTITKHAATFKQTDTILYIPNNMDFCEFSGNLWASSSDVYSSSKFSFKSENERGTVLYVESTFSDYGGVRFNYVSWKGEGLGWEFVDKIHFCIKHHVNIEGIKNVCTEVRFYDISGSSFNLLRRCIICDGDLSNSYEKWVCKDVNVNDFYYCEVYRSGEIGFIEIVGYKKFSLDKVYICKNC